MRRGFFSKEFRNLGIYFLDSLVLTPKGMSVAMQSLDQENTRSFFSGAQRNGVFVNNRNLIDY